MQDFADKLILPRTRCTGNPNMVMVPEIFDPQVGKNVVHEQGINVTPKCKVIPQQVLL